MRSSQAITVAKLSVARYTQLREVRLLLEGLATEKATALLTSHDIKRLEALHAELIAAEKADDRVAATLTNFQFHFTIYRGSQASDLVEILESIWLRNGPLLKFLYPHAAPTYRGKHQHIHLLDALRRRDATAARRAIQDDILEGGHKLVELMERIEAGTVRLVEDEDGETSLVFPPRRRKAAA
jgi:DNA-binding GntR family transcriptional regulator